MVGLLCAFLTNKTSNLKYSYEGETEMSTNITTIYKISKFWAHQLIMCLCNGIFNMNYVLARERVSSGESPFLHYTVWYVFSYLSRAVEPQFAHVWHSRWSVWRICMAGFFLFVCLFKLSHYSQFFQCLLCQRLSHYYSVFHGGMYLIKMS